MKALGTLRIGVMLAVLILTACAQDEPSRPPPQSLGLKGLTLGKRLSDKDMSDALGLECRAGYCRGVTTIANAEAEISVISDSDYLVASIYVTFAPKDFDTVSSALVAKFGKPEYASAEKKQNAFGAIFNDVTMTWESTDGSFAFLQAYGDGLRSSLYMRSKAQIEIDAKNRRDPKDDI